MWVLALALLMAWGDAAMETAPSGGPDKTARALASGIEGRIVIGPVRSVARRGMANDAPHQAKVSILDAAGSEVAVAESDPAGSFRVSLPPGSYTLRPLSPGRYPRASEQKVVVHRGKLTRVEIVYDSGMR